MINVSKSYRALSWLVVLLAFGVITKGAYVRLSDAGLGCPDWPGCYGHLLVPQSPEAVTNPAHLAARPLEQGKAWLEMIHRYLASVLGLLILALAALAWRRRSVPGQPLFAPTLLVPLVCLQGALGMWTVTLLLKPLVVTAHLVGGMTTFALLIWNLCAASAPNAKPLNETLKPLSLLALAVVAVQIFLGGWTSTNYAALACTDFPTCQGSFWPRMSFAEAFTLWRGLGVNYEFGVLDTPARTAIHYTHRLWAVVVAIVVTVTALRAWASGQRSGRRVGSCILVLLALQIALGVTNVLQGLPLPVAVMHNGVAALLLGSLVTLLYFATRVPRAQG